jgi:hypothetical protein
MIRIGLFCEIRCKLTNKSLHLFLFFSLSPTWGSSCWFFCEATPQIVVSRRRRSMSMMRLTVRFARTCFLRPFFLVPAANCLYRQNPAGGVMAVFPPPPSFLFCSLNMCKLGGRWCCRKSQLTTVLNLPSAWNILHGCHFQ